MIDPDEVNAVLKSIASNIRRYGHFQARRHSQARALYDQRLNPQGLCCVNVNPTTRGPEGTDRDYALVSAVSGEIRRRIAGHHGMFDADGGYIDLVRWNDTTPTDQVLKVLENA